MQGVWEPVQPQLSALAFARGANLWKAQQQLNHCVELTLERVCNGRPSHIDVPLHSLGYLGTGGGLNLNIHRSRAASIIARNSARTCS